MRFAVAICFLAALWTIDADSTSNNLEILRLQVRNAKENVENIIHQLQLLHNQAEEDTTRKVTEKWDDEQDSYRPYKNLLLTEIKKETSAAKAEDKDVDSCYDEALEGIEESEKKVNRDATRCNDVALNLIQSSLSFIDNLISTGNELISELDDVFLTCYDSDVLKMQSCIISELTKINFAVRVLNSDTISAEVSVVHVSDNVLLQATNCLKKAYSSVYSAGDAIKMRLSQCIENSEITSMTTIEPKAATKVTTEKFKKIIFNNIPYF